MISVIVLYIILLFLSLKYLRPVMISIIEDLYFEYILWKKGFETTDSYFDLLNVSKRFVENSVNMVWDKFNNSSIIIDNDSNNEYKILNKVIEEILENKEYSYTIKKDKFIIKKMLAKMQHDFSFLCYREYFYCGRFNGKYYWKGKLLK